MYSPRATGESGQNYIRNHWTSPEIKSHCGHKNANIYIQQSLKVVTLFVWLHVFKLVDFCHSCVFILAPETVAVLINGKLLWSTVWGVKVHYVCLERNDAVCCINHFVSQMSSCILFKEENLHWWGLHEWNIIRSCSLCIHRPFLSFSFCWCHLHSRFLNVRNTFYSSSCKSVLHASTNTIQNIETRVRITVISGRYIWKSLCICLKLLSIFAWSAAWAQILLPRARKNSTICLSLLLF